MRIYKMVARLIASGGVLSQEDAAFFETLSITEVTEVKKEVDIYKNTVTV